MTRHTKRKISRLLSIIFLAALTVTAVAGYVYNNTDFFSKHEAEPAAREQINAKPGSEMEIYFFDVGQGISQLVRIPRDEGFFNILIDTGEFKYSSSLVENLRKLGVEKLDIAVASHPHNDHMGGMDVIIEEFEIGEFFMPRIPDSQVPTTFSYEKMLEALGDKNVRVKVLNSETELELPSGAHAEVFSPDAGDEWEDLNDYSGVIKLSYGRTSFLFEGDAEAGVERKLVDEGKALSADVLVCGHHGSSSSTTREFLNEVNPDYAVISCGRDNQYGHPHRETIERLSEIDCTFYRTDERRTILAKTDGERIDFTADLPSVEEND